jgi:ABC-2 type transport system ATP-binding protein
MAIETHGLTRRFGRLTAVDGIELRVPVGSVYGFLGRNGAGKTTTIQMLMGLIEPTAGEMSVLGFDPLRQDVPMKRVVSYVPERVQMYDWMKVREIAWFGANIHPHWDVKLAGEMLDRFDLPRDRRVGALSRGMQGKLALALAMSSRPRLLILDDPTSGLDALVRREFMESIVGLLQEAGTTVFFSSHIIDDVERVADWIGIIDEGRLLVEAPAQELKSRVKRVVVNFAQEAGEPKLEGLLQGQASGREWVLIYRSFDEEQRQALEELHPLSVQVEDCSLEDIFVAYVRKAPEAVSEEVQAAG